MERSRRRKRSFHGRDRRAHTNLVAPFVPETRNGKKKVGKFHVCDEQKEKKNNLMHLLGKAGRRIEKEGGGGGGGGRGRGGGGRSLLKCSSSHWIWIQPAKTCFFPNPPTNSLPSPPANQNNPDSVFFFCV